MKPVVVALVTSSVLVLVWLAGFASPTGAANATTSETQAEAAVAFGRMLDAPVDHQTLERGVDIGRALRKRHGGESGKVARALIEQRNFSESEIASAAAALGYSLKPDVCGRTCYNVRQLALLELSTQALQAHVSE